MADPDLFQTTEIDLGVSVTAIKDGWVYVTVACDLPGVQPVRQKFKGDPGHPEEACSLYDDATHSIRAWSRCLELALEDLLLNQPRLF
jgi:hypothetical protein